MTSKRQAIRDAIVTLVGTISGIGSVSTHSRIFFEDIPVDGFPALDVIVGNESLVYDPADNVNPELQVIIRGSVGSDKTQNDLEDLIQATKNILATDFCLNGLVIDMIPTSIVTDEGFLVEPTFQMYLTIRHEHDFGSA